MKTIERNFTKNPHTARWLLAFHSANQGGGAVAEAAPEADTDLLDLVQDDEPRDIRTTGQRELMAKLAQQITGLDPELGAATSKYITDKSAAGAWQSPARGGDVSQWIDKMIAKVRELQAAAKPVKPAAAPQVADGRYAIEEDGELKFFHVRNGKAGSRWAGFTFLDIRASDDLYPIKDRVRKTRVLAAIAADPDALARYGRELGECGRCGRTLTSEYRNLGIGPVCIDK